MNQTIQMLLVVSIVVTLLIFGIVTGSAFFMYAVAIAIPMIIFASRFERLWAVTVAVAFSRLYIAPFTPALDIFHFLALMFSGLMIVHNAINKHDSPHRLPVFHKFLWGLLWLSIFLSFYRGLGIRALRSEMWGGVQYIILWTAILLCIYSSHLSLSATIVRRTIIGLFLLASLPFAFRIINEISGGQLGFLSNVIRYTGAEEAASTVGERHVARWAGIQRGGGMLVLLGLAFMRTKGKHFILSLIAIVAGFSILGIAGYRATVIGALLTGFFFVLFWRRRLSPKLYGTYAFLFIVFMVALAVAPRSFPLSFQRMFEWVPGIDIDPRARHSAEITTFWRIDFWRHLLPMVSDYWLIGRGLAFNLREAFVSFTTHSDLGSRYLFYTAVHNYHSGPLYLLLDYGLPGLLLAAGFMIAVLSRHIKLQLRPWAENEARQIHAVLTAFFISNVISYWIIFGALESLVIMMLTAALLEALVGADWRTQEALTPEKTVVTASVSGREIRLINPSGRSFV